MGSVIGGFFIYSIAFGVSIYLSHIYEKMKLIGYKKILFRIGVIVLPTLAIGLRDVSVGTDTANYVSGFLKIVESASYLENFTSSVYGLIVAITALISSSYTLYLIVIAFLTFYFYLLAVEKSKIKLSYPLMLFLYYGLIAIRSSNQMRQILALSILFYAVVLIENKFKKTYLVLIVLAIWIHFSLIFAVIIYFYFKCFVKTSKMLILTFISSIVAIFVFPYIAQFVAWLLPNWKYTERYLLNVTPVTRLGFGGLFDIATALIPALSIWFFNDKIRKKHLFYVSSFMVLFRIIAYSIYFVSRIYYNFLPFYFLFFAINLKDNKNKKYNKIMMCAVIVCTCMYYVGYYFVLMDYVYMPYIFAFQGG